MIVKIIDITEKSLADLVVIVLITCGPMLTMLRIVAIIAIPETTSYT